MEQSPYLNVLSAQLALSVPMVRLHARIVRQELLKSIELLVRIVFQELSPPNQGLQGIVNPVQWDQLSKRKDQTLVSIVNPDIFRRMELLARNAHQELVMLIEHIVRKVTK